MRSLRQVLFVTLVLMIGPLVGTAAAHTAFDSSVPADGDTVTGPLDELTLLFTAPADPAGAGFEILDGDGTIRTPVATPNQERTMWTLTLDQPLSPGRIAVRWSVAAPDAHPIQGDFTFDLLPTPATSAPTTSTSTTTTTTVRPGVVTTSTLAALVVTTTVPTMTVDEFLAGTDTTTTAERVAAGARIFSFGGLLAGLGVIWFAALVLRGGQLDLDTLLRVAQAAGIITVAAGAVEFAAQLNLTAAGGNTPGSTETLGELFSRAAGWAIVARIVAGILLSSIRDGRMTAEPATDPLSTARRLGLGAGAHGDAAEAWIGSWDMGRHRLAVVLASVVGLAAFTLDGHSTSEAIWPAMAVVGTVHVAAGALWAGGLLGLGVTLATRTRARRERGTAQLAVRFSVVAAAAVTAVAVAGVVLALMIAPVDALWSTSWGRVLAAKTAAAAVIGAIGAYNHRIAIPKLIDGEPDTAFRRALVAECALVAVVIALTAVLVGASTT